jgi:hypothetical protein
MVLQNSKIIVDSIGESLFRERGFESEGIEKKTG